MSGVAYAFGQPHIANLSEFLSKIAGAAQLFRRMPAKPVRWHGRRGA